MKDQSSSILEENGDGSIIDLLVSNQKVKNLYKSIKLLNKT